MVILEDSTILGMAGVDSWVTSDMVFEGNEEGRERRGRVGSDTKSQILEIFFCIVFLFSEHIFIQVHGR